MNEKKILVIGDNPNQTIKLIKEHLEYDKAMAIGIAVASLTLPYTRAHSIDQMLDSLVSRGERKESRKCLLPNCHELTYHNGGYCSAEHCKLHKQLKKERSK
jgi:hypothetical protein